MWYAAGGVLLGVIGVWSSPWGLLVLWPSAALTVVACGYLGFGPAVLGKRHGRLGAHVRVFFAPFLLPLSAWQRYRRDPDPFDEVAHGIILGRLVSSRRAKALVEQGVTAVLDMTCEHDEAGPFLDVAYRNVQVLDLTPPTPADLVESVRFVLAHNERGRVYVHCAQGFGRSAAVVAACLLASDGTLTVGDACEQVERARESVRLRSVLMHRRLEEFRARWRAEASD